MNREKLGRGKPKKLVIGVATIVAAAVVGVPTALLLNSGEADAAGLDQNKYVIIVSSSNESVPDYTLSVEKGTTIKELKTMLKAIDGYDITGIYKDAELTKKYQDYDYVTDDTKIFIKFEVQTFSVKIYDEYKNLSHTEKVDYLGSLQLEELEDKKNRTWHLQIFRLGKSCYRKACCFT